MGRATEPTGGETTQIRSMLVEQFGDAEVLQYTEAERPAPGEGEVLI